MCALVYATFCYTVTHLLLHVGPHLIYFVLN